MFDEEKKKEIRNSLSSLAENLNLSELKKVCNGEAQSCRVKVEGIEHEMLGRMMSGLIALDFSCEYNKGVLTVKIRESGSEQVDVSSAVQVRQVDLNGTVINVKISESNVSAFDEAYGKLEVKFSKISSLRKRLIVQSLSEQEFEELKNLREEIPKLESNLTSMIISEEKNADGMVVAHINRVWPVFIQSELVQQFNNNETQIELFSRQMDTWKSGPKLTDHLTRAQQNKVLATAFNRRKSLVETSNSKNEALVDKRGALENKSFVRIENEMGETSMRKVEEKVMESMEETNSSSEALSQSSNIDLNIYGCRIDTEIAHSNQS